jgi:hypothetical protein
VSCLARFAHLEASGKAPSNAELYAICDTAQDLFGKVATVFEPKKPSATTTPCWPTRTSRQSLSPSRTNFTFPWQFAPWKPANPSCGKALGVHVAECERLRDVVRARSGVHVQVGTRECPASPCQDPFPRRGRLGMHTGRAAVSRVPRQRGLAMHSPSSTWGHLFPRSAEVTGATCRLAPHRDAGSKGGYLQPDRRRNCRSTIPCRKRQPNSEARRQACSL